MTVQIIETSPVTNEKQFNIEVNKIRHEKRSLNEPLVVIYDASGCDIDGEIVQDGHFIVRWIYDYDYIHISKKQKDEIFELIKVLVHDIYSYDIGMFSAFIGEIVILNKEHAYSIGQGIEVILNRMIKDCKLNEYGKQKCLSVNVSDIIN